MQGELINIGRDMSLPEISEAAERFYKNNVRERSHPYIPYPNGEMKKVVDTPITKNGRNVMEHLYPVSDRVEAQSLDMQEMERA